MDRLIVLHGKQHPFACIMDLEFAVLVYLYPQMVTMIPALASSIMMTVVSLHE